MSFVAGRRRLVTGLLSLPVAACTTYGAPPLTELIAIGESVTRDAWSVKVSAGSANLVPVPVGATVWVADAAGEIVLVDPVQGSTRKRLSLGKPIASGVGSDGERQVVATVDGELVAFDRDGNTLWRAELGAEPLTMPAVGAGQVVLRLSNAAVVSYDLQSGERRWTHNRRPVALVLRHPSWITVEPNAVFVGLPAGRLLALSPGNGATLWETGVALPRGTNEIERIADVLGSPVRVGDQVCALAYQTRLACLSASRGRADWNHEMAGSGGVDADANAVVAIDTRDNVLAFTRAGRALWTNGLLRGRRLGVPRLVSGRVWVGDAGGLVHVIDAANGRLVGRVYSDGEPIVGPGVPVETPNGPLMVFQSLGGTVFAVALVT